MREQQTTADRLAAYSDAVFAVIVTIMVLELKAPDDRPSRRSGHLADRHQLRGELLVHRDHLDQP